MMWTTSRTLAAAVGMLLLVSVAPLVSAQSPGGMRLYSFTSGALTVPKSLLQGGAPSTPLQVPVGFFVIRHPKGNVLFDTGNNDRIITEPGYWGAFIQGLNPVRTADVAIDVQLGKIGLRPDDIAYVVVGHMHLDHGGNVGKFPNSTLVVQKDEIRNAFWPEPGTGGPYIPGDFMMLRADPGSAWPNRYKMIQLEGDLDIFADNSVVVKRWVGHTPGSQMMIVRLPRTGTVILTSDNVYFRENVTKNLLPDVSLA
jgi:N-acyl homoserine lactone hydrolase